LKEDAQQEIAGAELFRALHSGPDLLVLTNAWDAVSARVVMDLGAKAVATSSAAVAWSHGYPDGNALPVPLLLSTLADIVRVVSVPITADIEAGYSDDPRAVGDTVGAVIDVGVVGINLEDGRGSPDLLCAKVEAARQAAVRHGVPLFINARTDVFLRPAIPGHDPIVEAISRADRYAAAGADGIFVPGITDAAGIETLARDIKRPLNVMARPGLPRSGVAAARRASPERGDVACACGAEGGPRGLRDIPRDREFRCAGRGERRPGRLQRPPGRFCPDLLSRPIESIPVQGGSSAGEGGH
jgi:2-methylisocitrate lyase-like PEP mutase family enzyme